MTRYGGVGLLRRFMEKLGIRKRLSQVTMAWGGRQYEAAEYGPPNLGGAGESLYSPPPGAAPPSESMRDEWFRPTPSGAQWIEGVPDPVEVDEGAQ